MLRAGSLHGKVNGNGKIKVKSKVNNRAPPSPRNQLRSNRDGQYTVAFFNRSTLFAAPFTLSLQAHT